MYLPKLDLDGGTMAMEWRNLFCQFSGMTDWYCSWLQVRGQAWPAASIMNWGEIWFLGKEALIFAPKTWLPCVVTKMSPVHGLWPIPPIFRHRQTQMCFKCLQRLHQLCIWYPEVSQARSGSTTGGGPRRVLLFLMFEHMGLNMNMFKQFKPYYLI